MKNSKFPLLLVTTTLLMGVVAPCAIAAAPNKPTAASSGSDVTDVSGSRKEQASLRFQRGVSLYRERSFDAALAEFNRAHELAPNYHVLFNIGQVHVERGDFVAGIKAFRQYLSDGGSAIESARVTEVEAEILRLKGRIANITVTSNVSGAELFVDGEPVGRLPQARVPVNAGLRRLSLRKDGYEADDVRVMLATGEDKVFEIALRKHASATTAPTTVDTPSLTRQSRSIDAAESSGGLDTAFWVSLSATVIAAGATTTFGLLTRRANSDYDAALDHYPGSQSRIDDARQDVRRNALLTDVCGAATLVGVASTLFFAVSSKSDKPKQPTTGNNRLSWDTVVDGRQQLLWRMSGRF